MITRKPTQGQSLIEMLIYIAILVVVLGLGFSALYRCRENSLALKRNADDITRVLDAGERWRADVREANGSLQTADGGNRLRIATTLGDVWYEFEGGTVWRRSGETRHTVLKDVKHSKMLSDVRQHVTAWRWEVELMSPRKVVHTRPLFSFEAVQKAKP